MKFSPIQFIFQYSGLVWILLHNLHPCLRPSLTVASNLATQAHCREFTALQRLYFCHPEEVLLLHPFPFQSHVYQHYCNTLSTPDEATGAIMFFRTGYTTERQHSIRKEHMGSNMLTETKCQLRK